LPWQVSVGLGVAVFIGLKWILPALGAGNMFLKPISAAAAAVAWIFSGAFFLIGVIVFVKEKASKSKSATVTPLRPPEKWKEPSWAKHTTGNTSVDSTARRGSLGEPLESAVPAAIKLEPSLADNKPKPSEWTIGLLRDIEWKRFEDVCQRFYEKKGIRSETTALGPDGGIDIRLYQDDSGIATSIVQCKAWGERYVGVKPVRELLGVMTHERIGKAFFMTSGYYSDEAKAIATANRITLIDGDMLLMMIRRLPAEAQASLLAFAVEGDYATPTCPSCGIKMKHVQGKESRPDFWGCHNYPRCRQKLGMRRA
jgi:restriction system protein